MTSPVPGAVAVNDDFTSVMESLFPLCVLIGYIPMIYNLVFRIVVEKESRTKETMRIMGMTDLPYWVSWFVTYTLVNLVVTTVSWTVMVVCVTNYSNRAYIWLFLWLYGQAIFGQIIFL